MTLPTRLAFVTLWVCTIALAACGSDSGPAQPAAEIIVSFRPASDILHFVVGESETLWVEVEGTTEYTVAWTRGGVAGGTSDTYELAADEVGVDTVAVAVVAGGKEQARLWRVEVTPDESKLPREVADLNVIHGAEPAEVVVTWFRSTATAFPLVSYDVAVSYDERITDDNWDASMVAVTVPHDAGVLRLNQLLTEADDDIRPGQEAWFAVRARDDHGQLSPVGGSFRLVISYAWYLDVHVQDDAGRGLPSIILLYGDGERQNTDAAGDSRIGPLRSIDEVAVSTNASNGEPGEPPPWYYNFNAAPRGVDDGPLIITIVEKYELDLEVCGETPSYLDFMGYLQWMTYTEEERVDRPNRYLLRWDHYPVAVHFAPFDTVGVELSDLARAAMAIWNDALGQEVLVETTSEAEADILCVFDTTLGPFIAGRVSSLVPGGWLPDATPEVLLLALDPYDAFVLDELREIIVTEVTLHEFGHTLGLYNHSCLSGKGNLMDAGGAAGSLAEGPDNAIHATEWRAVRAIMNLPAGVDMAAFERQ